MFNLSLEQIDALNKNLSQADALLDLLSIVNDPSTKITPSKNTLDSTLWAITELVKNSHGIITAISTSAGGNHE